MAFDTFMVNVRICPESTAEPTGSPLARRFAGWWPLGWRLGQASHASRQASRRQGSVGPAA
jgi:hypothetical protein